MGQASVRHHFLVVELPSTFYGAVIGGLAMATDKHPTVTLTREQLYERLWVGSAQELAGELGLSNVDLARVCRKHSIPYPPLGHLAKKVFTAPTSRPPLPPSNDPKLQTITFCRGRYVENDASAYLPPTSEPAPKPEPPIPPEPAYDAAIMAMLRLAGALPKIKVSEQLTNLHPLVQATKDYFDVINLPWDKRRLLAWTQPHKTANPFNVSVSGGLQTRALLFLDALVKTVERIGGKVSAAKINGREKTSVSFAGVEVATIRLREKRKQVLHEPSPEDTIFTGKYDYLSTGILVLDSGEGYYGPVHCRDTEKTRRIEDAINSLVVRWVEEAGRILMARRQEEEERRRKAEEERSRRERETELRAKQESELSRLERFTTNAAAWREAENLRAYIEAAEERAIREHGRIEEGSELNHWLKWARQQADRLDPLTPSPPSILDESP